MSTIIYSRNKITQSRENLFSCWKLTVDGTLFHFSLWGDDNANNVYIFPKRKMNIGLNGIWFIYFAMNLYRTGQPQVNWIRSYVFLWNAIFIQYVQIKFHKRAVKRQCNSFAMLFVFISFDKICIYFFHTVDTGETIRFKLDQD